MTSLLFVGHFAATGYLVGLRSSVQRVPYPLMASVGLEQFAQSSRRPEPERKERIGDRSPARRRAALAIVRVDQLISRSSNDITSVSCCECISS
jgi:hypothetical protein